MTNVASNTDLCDLDSFVVNGSKCRVRLSETHLIVEQQPSPCYVFGKKKPLEIPLWHLISVKTTSSAAKKSKIFVLDVNLKIRCWLQQARQTVYDRSVKYENQSGGDNFWTPNLKESFGYQTNQSRGDTLIVHYATCNPNESKWSMNSITLKHTSEDVIANWSHLLYCALEKSSANRPKNILVFINPFGGKGQAQNIFNSTVAPLFRAAGVKFSVIVTERANHARDMLRSDPLDGVDGVICVGGDGMFSELFNGLLLRSIDENSGAEEEEVESGDFKVRSPKIRVGLIPGGSTNAVALSLYGTTDVVTAAMHILLGDRRNIDVSSVHSEGHNIYRFFMAMISYGYFGDLIVHSERLRWLGPRRYNVSGVHTFLGNKAYKGTINFVQETNPELTKDPRRINDVCYSNCGHCETVGKAKNSSSELHNEMVSKTIDGNFKVVTGAVTICACDHSPRGVTPSAHLGDGQLDLILVRKTSRLNYFRYLYRTGYMNKSPFDLPYVEVHRVKEFTFTPNLEDIEANDANDDTSSSNDAITQKNDGERSVWNCDGEILLDTKIRVKVHCQILPVFARGPERPYHL